MQLNHTTQQNRHTQAQRAEQATADRAHDQQYNFQYYEEYKRIYQTSYLLSMQLKQLAQSKQDLWAKINRFEKKTEEFKDDIRGEPVERKKRSRRTAEEIQRNFTCAVERCNKCYGSEGSLQQHIKLKHPQLYEAKCQNRQSQSHKGSGEDLNN